MHYPTIGGSAKIIIPVKFGTRSYIIRNYYLIKVVV